MAKEAAVAARTAARVLLHLHDVPPLLLCDDDGISMLIIYTFK
jgi:hypothetical protein